MPCNMTSNLRPNFSDALFFSGYDGFSGVSEFLRYPFFVIFMFFWNFSVPPIFSDVQFFFSNILFFYGDFWVPPILSDVLFFRISCLFRICRICRMSRMCRMSGMCRMSRMSRMPVWCLLFAVAVAAIRSREGESVRGVSYVNQTFGGSVSGKRARSVGG